MNVRALIEGVIDAIVGVQCILDMPETYARSLLLCGFPIAGAVAVVIHRRTFGTRMRSWIGALMPISIFGGVALTAFGHLVYRTFDIITQCQRYGASIRPWNHDASIRCRLENVFPLFPGNGGLLIHVAVSVSLLCWWLRSARLQAAPLMTAGCKVTSVQRSSAQASHGTVLE